MVCSEIRLKDVLCETDIVDEFCCCKLLVNNMVVWNNFDNFDEYVEFEQALSAYLSTHSYLENYVVTKINIKIVDFHHSIINIRCKKEEKQWSIKQIQ